MENAKYLIISLAQPQRTDVYSKFGPQKHHYFLSGGAHSVLMRVVKRASQMPGKEDTKWASTAGKICIFSYFYESLSKPNMFQN